MTDLREQMYDTFESLHTDLAALTVRAEREGGRLRRRYRLAAAGSTLAVLAVIGAGAATAADRLLDQTRPSSTVVAGQSPSTGGTAGRTGTGRQVVSALYAAILDVVPGTGSDFAGQSYSIQTRFSYGELVFTPANGSGAGLVAVNLQHKSLITNPEQASEELFGCDDDFMDDCQVTTLSDGSRLRTYAEHHTLARGETEEWLVAEHLVGNLRVLVSSSNGFERGADGWNATRSDSVLSIDQLTEIAVQPWWGFDLPPQSPGETDLPSYHEYSASLDGERSQPLSGTAAHH